MRTYKEYKRYLDKLNILESTKKKLLDKFEIQEKTDTLNYQKRESQWLR